MDVRQREPLHESFNSEEQHAGRGAQRNLSIFLTPVSAKEENADMLLNQIARSLMSVAKMPDAIEQSVEEA